MANSDSFPSDTELLRRCRDGEPEAWQLLLDKYERLVYSIPLKYGLSRDEAADVAQAAFTALIEKLDGLRDNSNLGGWLTTVTRRYTWRRVERAKRRHVERRETDDTLALLPDGRDHIAQWELVEWLTVGLNLIDKRCRELLLSLYFDEREPSYEEIAEQMRMAVGSVGPTRARCLERMRYFMQLGE